MGVEAGETPAETAPETLAEMPTPPADISAPPADPMDRHPLPIHGSAPYKNDPLKTHLEERIERERGREDDKKAVLAFRRIHADWPTRITDSEPEALRAWHGLTVDQQTAAIAAIEPYVAASKAAGRKLVCSFAVYLREKRWERLPPAPEVTSAPAQVDDYAAPFGPVWGAWVLGQVLAGPEVPGVAFDPLKPWEVRKAWPKLARILGEAACGRGWRFGARWHGLAAQMEPVPVGGGRWAEWQAIWAAQGWPILPDTGAQRVVYLPRGESAEAALAAFAEAINIIVKTSQTEQVTA